MSAHGCGEDVGLISIEQAEEWLIDDIGEAMALANDWLGPGVFDGLTEARQRAVVNMAFNLGNRIREFKRLRVYLIEGVWNWAAKEMIDSKWAKR